MTSNDYQQRALYFKAVSNFNITGESTRLLEGVMGMAGEAGECVELLKKHLFQGHDLDREHMAKEIGDVAWYVALAADALGYSLDEIMRMNLEKISDRYPEGYDDRRSIHRDPNDI